MAHLLGHRGCMESLRADLRDLQAAIADVSSRAGAVRFPSWKFPDKVSCELDLAALLERYGYTEGDPAFSQHSHVVLLELLIDRLLLLLQTFTGYAENLLSEQATPLPQAVGPCMSAGRTARTYWHSMLKLGAFHQQLLDERLQLGASSEVGRSTSQCPPSSVPAPGSSGSGSPVPRAARSTAESSRSISTQTTRSFLEPCATCASAQASLREVGQTITSICQSQNIPSALSRFQELVDNSTGRRTLSARDVSCWASEQSKDLSRISKHLQALLQQVSPLKAQLEDSEKQRDELQKQVEDISKSLQAEKKRRAQQRKEAEQRAEARRKEHLAAVARLERDKDELRRGAAVLEERLSALQEELAVKRAAVQELEGTKTTLREELRSATVARSRVMELEEKVQLLSGERERLGQELSATSTQLGKEKAQVESILRHEESLQAKQRVLMQHVDWLDQQREVLEASLGEAKEDKARLAEQLEESREQSRQQLRTQQVSAGPQRAAGGCRSGAPGDGAGVGHSCAMGCQEPPVALSPGTRSRSFPRRGRQAPAGTWPPRGKDPSPSAPAQTSLRRFSLRPRQRGAVGSDSSETLPCLQRARSRTRSVLHGWCRCFQPTRRAPRRDPAHCH
ncbi:coiled-coil domain-containing protein 157 isoform X3 [Falco biarmicus]|uniref:coiled-coil domain-containing protein 157 isoform X3 n=1 Tax=Falco biarmicus TaxID=345155 RepID=UPI0024BD0295|nr:coiled-coil domain-containing protein 157 isoform X3 [Falco biarmicus]